MDFYTVASAVLAIAIAAAFTLEGRKYNRTHNNFDLAYACLVNCIPRFRGETPAAILTALAHLEKEAVFSRELSVKKSLAEFEKLSRAAIGSNLSAKDQIQLMDIMIGVEAPVWFYQKNIPERSIVDTVGLVVKALAADQNTRSAHLLLLAN